MARVFCDASVLIRYFAEDDPPRALAAAQLIDSDTVLVVSGVVLVEVVHALRTERNVQNPQLADGLVRFLRRDNVEVTDADRYELIDAIRSTLGLSARRIPDAFVAAAAQRAGCDWIAAFDRGFRSPTIPVRLL
ncbi:MAG TPA: PIN domain-containing protein [Candidatus Limnocylindrales bacterium]|jgi:predicted nucleic acid-binding protein